MAGTRCIAAVVLGAVLAIATPAVGATTCDIPGVQEYKVNRSGHIPGLGSVTGTIGWDNRVQLTLAGRGFEVTRSITPAREVEITISGPGEDPLVIQVVPGAGLKVVRSGNVVWGTSPLSALRQVTDSPAVFAFREHIGEYERRLLAGVGASRPDDPHAYGFLLAGAFVSSLSGDPVAVGRTRDIIMRRIRGQLRAARDEFRDCVAEYERFLLKLDTDRTSCLQSANSQEYWYERASQRLLCEAEFMAGALSGEAQFISCSAFMPLIKN